MNKDLNYYQERTAAEEAAAEAAPDSRARAAHKELARRYDERCRELEGIAGDDPEPGAAQSGDGRVEIQAEPPVAEPVGSPAG
jgi:hypothetical protein